MRAIGIEAAGVTKRFGAFTALEDVSLKVQPGTIHALLGENGAGKSTFVKCLLGYYRADAGDFLIEGKEERIAQPQDADRLGLGMVYQHFTLVPSMTAAENLVMARADVPLVIDWKSERKRLDEFMSRMPFRIPLDIPLGTLAAGERQKAEILKQLYLARRLLVLDEPTSTLTPQEAEDVLNLMRSLADARELTIIIITHKLKEVMAFADDVTVLRRGKMAGGGKVAELTPADMTTMMIGEAHTPATLARTGNPEASARLKIRELRSAGDHGRPGLDINALNVRPHEIVGIAGVSGNGQRELVEVLGGQRLPVGGEIRVSDQGYHARRNEMHALGVRLLPEEPLRNGCAPGMSVISNLNLRTFDRTDSGARRFWLDRRRMVERGRQMTEMFGIRTPSPDAPIGALSGGNVQRAVLARELDGDVEVLIVANPCFGLDVKAVAEIRARIVAARNAGTAVLLISEDLDEILELSDRIVVMCEGKIVYETPGAGADAHEIGRHMAGHA
jgi:simple sugar transport system ATP-binding protein